MLASLLLGIAATAPAFPVAATPTQEIWCNVATPDVIAWSAGGECYVKINGQTRPINATTHQGTQDEPCAAQDENGNVLAACNQRGYPMRLLVTCYGPGGALLHGEQTLGANGYQPGSSLWRARVRALPGGGFVLAATKGNFERCVAYWFDSQGNPLTGEVVISLPSPGRQQSPDVIAMNDGALLFVWDDPASGTHKLRARRVTGPSASDPSAPVVLGVERALPGLGQGDCREPRASVGYGPNAWLTWGQGSSVRAGLWNHDSGVWIVPPFTCGQGRDPQIAPAGQGAVIVWDRRTSTNRETHGCEVGMSGAGPEFVVATNQGAIANTTQNPPSIAGTPGLRTFIVGYSNGDAMARAYERTGP